MSKIRIHIHPNKIAVNSILFVVLTAMKNGPMSLINQNTLNVFMKRKQSNSQTGTYLLKMYFVFSSNHEIPPTSIKSKQHKPKLLYTPHA